MDFVSVCCGYFARLNQRLQIVKNFIYDLTCDVISDLQNKMQLSRKVYTSAINCHFRIENRSSSLADGRGQNALPPPAPSEHVTRQTPSGRGLSDVN